MENDIGFIKPRTNPAIRIGVYYIYTRGNEYTHGIVKYNYHFSVYIIHMTYLLNIIHICIHVCMNMYRAYKLHNLIVSYAYEYIKFDHGRRAE